MEPLRPIDTAPLFPPLHAALVALLRTLTPRQWEVQTVAPRWRVRDVAAHLLDGDLRKLSAYRDGHRVAPETPFATNRDVVDFVNTLNASGVEFARRLSPRLIVDLLEMTGPAVSDLVAALPPDGDSIFPVSWAGESRSANWMDTGREYTERWHHQMQIRDAVGAPLLLERRWLAPLLDISVRVLPVAYASTSAREGITIVLAVSGEGGGVWSLVREGARWALYAGEAPDPATRVDVEPDAAWRLFYNAPVPAGLTPRVSGDTALAAPLLAARSVLV